MWRGASKEALTTDFSRPLTERLLEITAQVRSLVPAEKLAAPDQAAAELEAAGAAQAILPVGTTAPEFELASASGGTIRSADLLATGPLIINFFRGRWCPYCIAELETWQALAAEVTQRGASLVAISPQTVRHNSFTADQHGLTFPVLSDPGNRVARSFGLVHRLPEYLQQHYRRIFVNLPHTNGDDSWELPLPATYVIGREGRVLFAEAFADFKQRPEPLTALRSLTG